MEKNCERPVFFEELKAARNDWKVPQNFKKIPNSLRLKNCSSEAVGEEIHIVVNLGLKYEGDLGY